MLYHHLWVVKNLNFNKKKKNLIFIQIINFNRIYLTYSNFYFSNPSLKLIYNNIFYFIHKYLIFLRICKKKFIQICNKKLNNYFYFLPHINLKLLQLL